MSFFSKKIGIDLGTANTLVIIPGKGIVRSEPSVVAISEHDHSILAIGEEAREMIGRTPDSIIAYRPMRGGVIADYRVTEALLRHMITKTMGSWSFFKPTIMVSVPAGVNSTQRRAVIEAGMKAGAKQVYLVREPIVAAIGAGIPIYQSQGHMVIDIGGGTTDVAVIALGGIVASTSIQTAGNNIDRAISDFLKKKYNLAVGDRTAEKIKVKIGSAVLLDTQLHISVKGRDYMTGLPQSIPISSHEITQAIAHELDEIIRAIKEVLHMTPPELASDIIDNGIIMTGGSSQLRGLGELIYRETGVKAKLADEPLYCVAYGISEALSHTDLYAKVLISKR